jgi:hypothetical protein
VGISSIAIAAAEACTAIKGLLGRVAGRCSPGAFSNRSMYRVRTVNGEPVLKGMKRWPAALDG